MLAEDLAHLDAHIGLDAFPQGPVNRDVFLIVSTSSCAMVFGPGLRQLFEPVVVSGRSLIVKAVSILSCIWPPDLGNAGLDFL